jgi:acetylglutamate kinase
VIEDLIRHNKVSGGMVLKLDAAKRALEGGVRQVRIVGGSQPGALLSAVNGAKRLGTRVMPMFPVSGPRKALQRVRATG